MSKFTSAFFGSFIALLTFSATPSYAAPDLASAVSTSYGSEVKKPNKASKKNKVAKKNNVVKVSSGGRHAAGPKPGRWCGWWMRTQFGGGAEYNLARNWAKRGRPASGPKVGVVVVWRGHVGIITGKASDGRWVVKSGNDGNAVRERARSLKHRTGMPIAYRYV
jgi:hypothetical protein